VSTRSCPDWPDLLERAPDLIFKHYTVAEAQLPADVLSSLAEVSLNSIEICCDIDKHVFNDEHTDAKVADALRESHWYDLREWTATGPGSTAQ
jgi:hypothetical protein